MPLPIPNLDDRDFDQLLADAEQYLKERSPAWSELSPADPGIILLEVFAHLTTTMIYRLNNLPDSVFISLLRLIGVTLYPPAAASALLEFRRMEGAEGAITIPRGTRVTLERTDASSTPPIFITTRSLTIAPDEALGSVTALHCELVEAELIGIGTGLPGQIVHVGQPPVVERTGEEGDFFLGIEIPAEEVDQQTIAREYGGKVYRIWREVENFSNLDDLYVFILDRLAGTISFAPALRTYQPGEQQARKLAEVPPAGREIRAWYRRGGGADGNVAAHTLTILKDPVKGVAVTNPQPATGGQNEETLDNAVRRGPLELYSLQRAVTARDFEQIALRNPEVARARAFTKADLWSYAQRGTVEITLVPSVPEEVWAGKGLAIEDLTSRETKLALQEVSDLVTERRPLGTASEIRWAQYKPVKVAALVVVRSEENPERVRDRILDRLHHTINPLPSEKYGLPGWAFGQPLRASQVYDVVLSEPGVRWVESVELELPYAPASVSAIAADFHQPATWYAGSEAAVYRSVDNGRGWELALTLDAGEKPRGLHAHPDADHAGIVALVTQTAEGRSRLYMSRNCGDNWQQIAETEVEIHDVAWSQRGDRPSLFVAAENGLFEINLFVKNSLLVPVPVADHLDALGFYAVVARASVRGDEMFVAVAARDGRGVYFSREGGRRGSFEMIPGSAGYDVRLLAVQRIGVQSFLWAGTYAPGSDPGDGCFRINTSGGLTWEPFGTGWQGGSCRGLAFLENEVLAATHRKGIMRLDSSNPANAWQLHGTGAEVTIPLRSFEERLFVPVAAIEGNGEIVMAGVDDAGRGGGVYRMKSQSLPYEQWAYEYVTARTHTERVTLPSTWLFVSGEHHVEVITEDEAERN